MFLFFINIEINSKNNYNYNNEILNLKQQNYYLKLINKIVLHKLLNGKKCQQCQFHFAFTYLTKYSFN